MINPISFLWRQFNGPQITAICQAVWQYLKDTYDAQLEYLHNVSIDKSTTEHLTLIGSLQDLARPLVPVPDESVFWFTETYGFEAGYGYDPKTWYEGHLNPDSEYPTKHGFTNMGGANELPIDPSSCGHFVDVAKASGYSYIPDSLFRAIIRANTQSSGELGSLVALDDIMLGMWRLSHPTQEPIYRFSWSSSPNTVQADLYVDMGVSNDWTSPYEVQAELRLLGKTIYYPMPRLLPILKEGESRLDPIGFIQILLETEGSIYGLDAMWEGIGTPSDIVDDGKEPEFSVEAIPDSWLTRMWQQDNTWPDEEAPTASFIAMPVEQIQNMWT